MLIFSIGWIGNILLALILLRGLQRKLVSGFWTFYLYVAAALVATLLLSVMRHAGSGYARCYWIANFVTLFLGRAILWEMIARMWTAIPATKRAAVSGQIVLVVFASAAVIAFYVLETRNPANTVAFRHLERDCRAMQAVFFVVIVSPAVYFGMSLARHFRAICLGYGLYVLASLVSLAFLSYSPGRRAAVFVDLQAVSFDVATVVWLIGLWNADTAVAMPAKQKQIRKQHSMRSGIEFGSKLKLGSETRLSWFN